MRTIAFFNNKGGVGKTSLVYHLAWMYAELGLRVLVADMDPQANLTAMFLDEPRLLDLWENGGQSTIADCLQPLIRGTGDIADPTVERITDRLGLLAGDLRLSGFEDRLAESWPKCMDGQESAFRIITAFHRTILAAASSVRAEVVLIDVGPNLGAINRSTLIAAHHVVVPLAPDLYSLQGLRNLGPSLRSWRREWHRRLGELPPGSGITTPAGAMQPAGYVVMQHSVRENRPVQAYQRWLARIPAVYRAAILDQSPADVPTVAEDPHCLALLKHYRSLMPLAQDAHKPMFFLKAADGAIGGHIEAVRDCFDDFKKLSGRIAQQVGLPLP